MDDMLILGRRQLWFISASATWLTSVLNQAPTCLPYSPSDRPMISFMISLVPPKKDKPDSV
jgi:hypothetical protein